MVASHSDESADQPLLSGPDESHELFQIVVVVRPGCVHDAVEVAMLFFAVSSQLLVSLIAQRLTT